MKGMLSQASPSPLTEKISHRSSTGQELFPTHTSGSFSPLVPEPPTTFKIYSFLTCSQFKKKKDGVNFASSS